MNEYRGLKYTPNVNPQGRARAFFCCYEKDFDRLFEPITKEILNIQNNATIWYYDPKEGIPDDENFIADLSEMNLFIVPITSGFLYQKSNARNVEFTYAIKHNIPVLPLMQEPGLEDDFNRICGDLQFLDKNASSNDPTALPYEDKLKKYLESVLVSDELAQKIRKAFDAYIFLSYRKKDRKYAQNIMRLIHKNEFCRDIAIWYDEFLIPGENFNDAIEEAMKDSKLFAMVVTPNLLEIPNYVRNVEFKAAKDLKKTILSVEGQKTDSAKLSKVYSGIPETVDETGLPEHLQEWKHSIALKENDKDPEQFFLIGLAYLAGIDVEVNHERALKLITSSAEANLPEAYEKLVSMYQNGEGVERNYNTAIEWQKKYVKYLETAYEQHKEEPTLLKLVNNIWSLGNYQYDCRKLDEANNTFHKMLNYSESIKASVVRRRYKTISFEYFGKINNIAGKPKEARDWYLKSMESRTKLADETKTVQAWEDLAISYYNLGYICEVEGKPEEAKAWYLKNIEICTKLADETKAVRVWGDLAASYNNIGNISYAEGKPEEARACYMKSMRIFKVMANETKTVRALGDLAASYNNLGNISQAEGKLEEARVWYLKSMEICANLVEGTNTVQARSYLATSYNNLGNISKDEGKLEEARTCYLKSMEIRTKLADETKTVQALGDLAASYYNLGYLSEAERNPEQARKWHLKSIKIRKKLADETSTIQAREDLANSYNNLGNISQAEGKLEEARTCYLKSMEICANLVDGANTVQARSYLATSYNNLGNICKAEGKLEEARTCYLKSMEICANLADGTNTVLARSHLATIYNNLGNINIAESRPQEARTWCLKSMEIRTKLADETNTIQTRRDLAASYNYLGYISEAESKPKEAKAWYLKCLSIFKELATEANTGLFRQEYSFSNDKFRVSANAEVNLTEEKEWFSAFISSLLQSADGIKSVQTVDDLFVIYARLGMLLIFTEEERQLFLKQTAELCEILFRQTRLPKYQRLIQRRIQANKEIEGPNKVGNEISLKQKMKDEKIKEGCYKTVIEYINSGKDPNIVKVSDYQDVLRDALKEVNGVKSEEVCGIDCRTSGLFTRKQYYILYTKTGIASNYSDDQLIRYDKINDITIGKNGISISTFTGKRIDIDFKKANKSVYNFISEILKTIRRIRILD